MANPNPSHKFPKKNNANPTGESRWKEMARLKKEDRTRFTIAKFLDDKLESILEEFGNMNPEKCRNAAAWHAKMTALSNLIQYVTPKMTANANANMDFSTMKPEQIVSALRTLRNANSPENEPKVIDITPEPPQTPENK